MIDAGIVQVNDLPFRNSLLRVDHEMGRAANFVQRIERSSSLMVLDVVEISKQFDELVAGRCVLELERE